MQIRDERAERIDDYIEQHKSENTGRKLLFEINGKRKELDVVSLPLDLLVYNIRNGRFAAELQEREASEGRRLDPEDVKDTAIIEDLLLANPTKTEWLRGDIKRVGQLDPATITANGLIINGNRRAAILNRLHKETGNQKYAFLDVVKLPANVSPSDLWRFEAGFQLSTELKAPYGPINELLKIKEGRDLKLDPKEIAVILGGDNNEETVQDKLNLLTLIEDYLVYFGQDKRYSMVEGRVEHFIDVANIIKKPDWKKFSPEEQNKLLHAAYHMINDAKLAHMDIRKIGAFLKDPKEALDFADQVLITCGVMQESDTQKKRDATQIEPLEEDIKKLEAKISTPISPPKLKKKKQKNTNEIPPVEVPKQVNPSATKEKLIELFDSTVEKVDLVQQRKKPGLILKRVEANLQALNEVPDVHLKSYNKEFERIEKLIKDLAKRFG